MSEIFRIEYVQTDRDGRNFVVVGPGYRGSSRLPEGWAMCLCDKLNAEAENAALRAEVAALRTAINALAEFDECMGAQRKGEPYPKHDDDEACADGVCFKVGALIARCRALAPASPAKCDHGDGVECSAPPNGGGIPCATATEKPCCPKPDMDTLHPDAGKLAVGTYCHSCGTAKFYDEPRPPAAPEAPKKECSVRGFGNFCIESGINPGSCEYCGEPSNG